MFSFTHLLAPHSSRRVIRASPSPYSAGTQWPTWPVTFPSECTTTMLQVSRQRPAQAGYSWLTLIAFPFPRQNASTSPSSMCRICTTWACATFAAPTSVPTVPSSARLHACPQRTCFSCSCSCSSRWPTFSVNLPLAAVHTWPLSTQLHYSLSLEVLALIELSADPQTHILYCT